MIVAASMTVVSVSAFAASVSLTPSTTEVKPGDTFTVAVDIADNPGFTNVAFELFYYMNGEETKDGLTVVSHDVTALGGTDFLWPVEDENLPGYDGAYSYLSWKNPTLKTDISDNGTLVTYTYKVEENVADGTEYVISIESDKSATKNYAGTKFDFGSDEITIKVVAPAPAFTAPEVGIETDAKQGPSGKWAAGILGTVNFDPTKNTTFSTIEITPNNGTVDANPVEFTVADGTVFESAVTVKCALNITKCPDEAAAKAITAKGIVK